MVQVCTSISQMFLRSMVPAYIRLFVYEIVYYYVDLLKPLCSCKAFEQDTVVLQLTVSFYFEENGKQIS